MSESYMEVSVCSIAQEIHERGYAHRPASVYHEDSESSELELLKTTWSTLPKDTYSPGNRYRAHAKCEWSAVQQKALPIKPGAYFQSIDYNHVDGNKHRYFAPIESHFLNSRLLNHIIEKDAKIAHHLALVDLSGKFEIGLHQIRYQASPRSPSFSSPLWLHRDDERLVFSHLFHYSDNATGGNLIVAEDTSRINDVVCLKKPLATLVVNQKNFHALTPLGTSNQQQAFRDILLVTFL